LAGKRDIRKERRPLEKSGVVFLVKKSKGEGRGREGKEKG
jgi:hypothetical protein